MRTCFGLGEGFWSAEVILWFANLSMKLVGLLPRLAPTLIHRKTGSFSMSPICRYYIIINSYTSFHLYLIYYVLFLGTTKESVYKWLSLYMSQKPFKEEEFTLAHTLRMVRHPSCHGGSMGLVTLHLLSGNSAGVRLAFSFYSVWVPPWIGVVHI